MNQFGNLSAYTPNSDLRQDPSLLNNQTFTAKFFEFIQGEKPSLARDDTPRLVIFGGRDLLSELTAEKFCRFVAKELDTKSTPIISAFYNCQILEDRYFQDTIIDFYEHGASSKLAQAAADVARSFIQERLLLQDLLPSSSMDSVERQKLVNLAADRFKKITLFGFSFGSIVLNAFDRELALQLVSQGFSSEESALLRSHLALVTIGDVAFQGAHCDEASAEWSIPAIHIASTRDIYAGPTLKGGISYNPAQIDAFYLSNGKRIAVTAPLRRIWYGISEGASEKVKLDHSGHTPPVYLTPKVNIVSSPYSIFIPVMVRSIVHAMLVPDNRPLDATALLRRIGAYSPLGNYYQEYIDDLLKTCRANLHY